MTRTQALPRWFICPGCGKRTKATVAPWCNCHPAQHRMRDEEMVRSVARAVRGWTGRR
jgi:hypothetical protein